MVLVLLRLLLRLLWLGAARLVVVVVVAGMEGGVSEGRGSLNGPLFFALDVVTNVFRFVVVMFEKILFSLFLCVVSFHDMLLLLLSLLSLCSCPFLFLFHSFIHSFTQPNRSLFSLLLVSRSMCVML